MAFFLSGGTAAGLGRGERIRPLADCPLPGSVLLAWPGFSVATREAYGLVRAPALEDSSRLTEDQVDTKIRQFREVAAGGRWSALRNALEAPVLARFPALATLKRTLYERGCLGVLLTGSGSTLIGFGPGPVLARTAEDWVRQNAGRCFLCRGIGRADYVSRLGLEKGSGCGGC